ncbi:hypothetical protein ET418_12230 [Oryzomonas rubra]|uniref:Uncharacterized protein n=2 Tax=Oryzomonas TaxID=2855184 RepID=A0A5A9XDA2_9BACT|nr:hypothetical protein ET418_12230 [Oryzomonas rubra]KAB0668594.1 hypothetical protein F6V30_15975 [Oryzomonas sagensis]
MSNEQERLPVYAKFPFYSIAQMYAISIEEPVAILLGQDNLYWVVDQVCASDYLNDGCSLLSAAD